MSGCEEEACAIEYGYTKGFVEGLATTCIIIDDICCGDCKENCDECDILKVIQAIKITKDLEVYGKEGVS